MFYFVIRSPIRWCYLIRSPGFQRFRWLQRNIRDGFSNVRNTINNPLRRILRSYSAIRLKKNKDSEKFFIKKTELCRRKKLRTKNLFILTVFHTCVIFLRMAMSSALLPYQYCLLLYISPQCGQSMTYPDQAFLAKLYQLF